MSMLSTLHRLASYSSFLVHFHRYCRRHHHHHQLHRHRLVTITTIVIIIVNVANIVIIIVIGLGFVTLGPFHCKVSK